MKNLVNKQKLESSVLLADRKVINAAADELTALGLPRKDNENGFTIYAPMLNDNSERKLCPVLRFTTNSAGNRVEWDSRFITLNL